MTAQSSRNLASTRDQLAQPDATVNCPDESSVAATLLRALERLRLPFTACYAVVPIAPEVSTACAVTAQSVLGAAERVESTRLRSPKRRAEFLAGRMAAKRAAARTLGRADFADLEIIKQPNGAPALKQHRELILSISHSAQFALAVASYHPIGIDLELETQRPRELARWFFSPHELQQLAKKAGPDWHALVNLLWTRKEAVAKVGQWGASLPFARIDCTRPTSWVGSTALRVKSVRSSGYVLSVAHEELPGDCYG